MSLSQTNALSYQAGNERLPEYPAGSGQHPRIEDGIAASGAKKVYLMLGMNCIASGVDRVSQDLVTLVSKIQEKSPGIAVLIESVTPMTADSPRRRRVFEQFHDPGVQREDESHLPGKAVVLRQRRRSRHRRRPAP